MKGSGFFFLPLTGFQMHLIENVNTTGRLKSSVLMIGENRGVVRMLEESR